MGRKSRRGYPDPYKSKLEFHLHKGAMSKLEYEPKWAALPYVITGKTYNPDFASKSQPNIVYEAKGYFRTFDEAKKYIYVRESNPEITIRFIITDPNKRAYPQTKMGMGDWLTKQGFEWCLETDIPAEWREDVE